MGSVRKLSKHELQVIRPAQEIQEAQAQVGPCKKCRGAGHTRADVPYGHPQFGKPVDCECKLAKKKAELIQALYASSGIANMKRYQNETFETFNHRMPGVQEAYHAALAYSDDPRGWLVLKGGNGSGKTHLVVAIGKRQIDYGHTVLIQTVPTLLDSLRATFEDESQLSYNEQLKQIMEADLAIFDDLGAQNKTPWGDEQLFKIFNYRYNGDKPTVVTLNRWSGIDTRIVSRLQDEELGRVIEMANASDYRTHNKRRAKEDE